MTGDQEPVDRVRNWQRDVEIWERYAAGRGVTMAELGQEYGLTESGVSYVIKRMRSAIPLEERQARQRRQLDELDEMRAELWKIIKAGPIPAYSNGRAIYLADGVTMAEDHSARMRAVDLLRSLHEREAKAVGTDAPTRLEVETTPVTYHIVGIDLETLR